MKAALELLGYDGMRVATGFGITDLELVAERAREEMRDTAAALCEKWATVYIRNRAGNESSDVSDAMILNAKDIRELPVKP